MKMEFNIIINEEYPRMAHTVTIQVNAIINGREYGNKEVIREDASPVYFDYIWEKIGEQIKEGYLKSLK
jgi:hypothetical protein